MLDPAGVHGLTLECRAFSTSCGPEGPRQQKVAPRQSILSSACLML
jgi:hypothetical protein